MINWGVKDKYLVVGVGDGSLEEILKRADGTPPEWLAKVRKQLPIERQSTISYVNVKKIIEQFAPLGGARVQMVVDALGLGNVTSLAAVSGLEGEGFVNRTLVGTEGDPAGVLCLATGKPLGLTDLDSIPRDADFAVAGRLDLARVMERAIAIAGKIEPQAGVEIERNLKMLDEHLGIDLRKDVVELAGRRMVRVQFAKRGRTAHFRVHRRGAGKGLRQACGRPCAATSVVPGGDRAKRSARSGRRTCGVRFCAAAAARAEHRAFPLRGE